MGDRLLAVAIIFDATVAAYAALVLAQRACLRRSLRNRRRADWSLAQARGCRKMALQNASRAERAGGVRAKAFYRGMSESLPKDADRHEGEAKAHALRALFWDALA